MSHPDTIPGRLRALADALDGLPDDEEMTAPVIHAALRCAADLLTHAQDDAIEKIAQAAYAACGGGKSDKDCAANEAGEDLSSVLGFASARAADARAIFAAALGLDDPEARAAPTMTLNPPALGGPFTVLGLVRPTYAPDATEDDDD